MTSSNTTAIRTLLIISLILCTSLSHADETESLWLDIEDRSLEPFSYFSVAPDQFRSVEMDVARMESLLFAAPLDPDLQDRYPSRSSAGAPGEITLPTPDGDLVRFEIHDAPVMAEELARRFPEIQSYRAVSLDNSATQARLTFGPDGLNAMVLDVDRGTWLIDPMQRGQFRHYASYYKRDYHTNQVMACGVTDHLDHGLPSRGGVSNAGILRTYRLAVATTGEYAQFHGGTVPSALAAIVVAMTRVNGVYERDIGLRMELIANNDQIIYTDGATDPYTNNSGFTMLGENQSNIDSVIGSANYDIGHVFSTGGGGVAGLGVPCRSGSKARGVTGLGSPQNDVFYIDYVAHEMGHQWGGNHTFNGSTGACSGGNRNGSTAYEPGSGATIQAYAGICGSQNLQNNSDDYFHGISLQEMINYSTSGSGNGCSDQTPVANEAPTVNAGQSYTIPANTPFELCGTASDNDGDTITYAWEEFDLGPAGAPGNPVGDAPIFRSFQPTTSPCRIFPRRLDLLNNTQTIGELLPSYSRNMTFRLSVRDNATPAGGVNSSEMNLDVVDTGDAFEVLTPAGGASWETGAVQQVTWNVAATDQAPINCASVDIRLSADGGQTFTEDLLLGAANNGMADVTPQTTTDMARIEVRCSNNVFLDISPGNFDIIDGGGIFADGFETTQ